MSKDDKINLIEKKGKVVSNKMAKTAVVIVERDLRHPKYGKVIRRGKKYYAHTEKDVVVGQEVTIRQCRPISKLKKWRLVENN